MEEQNAIVQLKQGKLNGLEILVERYQARATQAAYLITHDRASAEDAAQTAFIKVAERIQQFDEARPFAPWFFRIVINEALKLAKRMKRQTSLEDVDEDTAALAARLADSAPQPESTLEAKQIREHILQAIHSLPPEQRAVVVMRYYLDMSEADMSAQLERPLSSIKWWLRDARKRLSQLLAYERN
ncbi:MAG: sigma-70 family RNA polymerase sigma factor [Anaerolineales bacterium]|nr:sigma-70 family RNA polymerase sigma factor [Anaerolineales bacterium]